MPGIMPLSLKETLGFPSRASTAQMLLSLWPPHLWHSLSSGALPDLSTLSTLPSQCWEPGALSLVLCPKNSAVNWAIGGSSYIHHFTVTAGLQV